MSFVNLSQFETKHDYLATLLDISHVHHVGITPRKVRKNSGVKNPDWESAYKIDLVVKSGNFDYKITKHCPSKAGAHARSFTVNNMAYQILRVIYGYDKITGGSDAD